ncbi:MAG TPA: hypothetical protein VML55_12120 [Planctomycetaceae bacterium]|nr:hypothetical protein [Planctomycetaceae bacterium]
MEIHIPLSDRELAVHTLPALVFTSGSNAGYIEVTLQSEEPLPLKRLYDGLRLHVPGELELLPPTAHDETGTGAVFMFFSAEVSNSGRLPHAVGLVWGENGQRPIAPLAFEEAGSERLREMGGDPELAGQQTRSDIE